MESTVLVAIAELENCKGKTDKESYENIKRIVEIMEGRSNKAWPTVALSKIVYKMNTLDRQVFLDVMKDAEAGLKDYLNQKQDVKYFGGGHPYN